MNRSLLRFYTLSVCIITAFSVLVIAGLPVWQAALRSKHTIEQHEIYQYISETSKSCVQCDNATSLLPESPSGTSTIKPYETKKPTEEEMESTLLDSQWLPEPFIVAARILIGLIGILIFLVHWQLYRNLGYVE